MENRKNLILLFPGKGYKVTCPLLYYAYMKYERKGYECIEISYGDFNNIDDAKNNAEVQINKLDFSNYDDVVFLSKSMGTVIAGEIEEGIVQQYQAHISDTYKKNTAIFKKRKKHKFGNSRN